MKREEIGDREGKPGGAKGTLLALVLMAAFLSELLVYTWCRVQYTRTGYEISRTQSEQARLTTLQKRLQVELARLKSPGRLARIGETSLGLKMPSPRQMVIVK